MRRVLRTLFQGEDIGAKAMVGNRTAQEARWSRLRQRTRKVCFAIVIVKL